MGKLEFVLKEPDCFDVYCGSLKIGKIEKYDSIGQTQWYLTLNLHSRINNANNVNEAISAISKEWKKIEEALKTKRSN